MSREAATAPGAARGMKQDLPMVTAQDEAVLAAEREELVALAGRPPLERWRGYARRSGPGWLQSAITLGGGTAMSSLFLGAYFGYRLLWLQPLAMILGIVMLSSIAHQTLSTRARTFGAMRRYVAPWVAWAWAGATVLSTVIWHLPQYGLAAGMTEDMIAAATGWQPQGLQETVLLLLIGVAVLAISTVITWNYANGYRGIRIYEALLKVLVWLIVLAFLAVAVRGTMAGKVDWAEVLKGLVPLYIPTSAKGVATVMAAFGAAVGINMTFLYPYTLLARRWGPEHRALSRFDLATGMFIPFTLATGLIVIAAAATLHGTLAPGTKVTPVIAASMLEAAGLGRTFARYVFGLGILGMVMSTITLHMLVNGFALCEMLGIEPTGWKYKLACLSPAPGLLGVILWQHMGAWIAVPTSAICGVMMPIAWIAFFLLHNNPDYLGNDRVRGGKAVAWNLGMACAIAGSMASAAFFLHTSYGAAFGLTEWLSAAGAVWLALGLIYVPFWLWLLTDCLLNRRDGDKTAWVLVLLALPVIGALLYLSLAYEGKREPAAA